jgi:hypothetical protein
VMRQLMLLEQLDNRLGAEVVFGFVHWFLSNITLWKSLFMSPLRGFFSYHFCFRGFHPRLLYIEPSVLIRNYFLLRARCPRSQ